MKVFLVLPAYNASKTLVNFFENVSKHSFHKIILVDDGSQDDTVSIAEKLAKRHPSLSVHRTLQNLGYGGNLKFCLSEALKMGADVIVELHPDGEYLLDGITPALQEIKNGATFVLGNRFTKRTDPRKAGMFWWKYPVLRLLTFLHNLVLGSNIPDLHQGFRVYTKEMLQVCDYRKCSNSFLFSFQIISQAVFRRQTISSVQVGTRYTGKKRGATIGHSLRYSFGTFIVLGQFFLARRGVKMALFMKPRVSLPSCILCDMNYFVTKRHGNKTYNLFYCDQCLIAFTYPQAKNIASYYSETYWHAEGLIGNIREIVFHFFQKRRGDLVQQYLQKGIVLDVGSGEGKFAASLSSEYSVTNIESPFAKVKNPSVIKTDFLSWRYNKAYDTVTFWESLEHVPDPRGYAEKTYRLLKKNGHILVECPRYDSLEARLFGSSWFHLDMPRHTVHFTNKGLELLLRRSGFGNITVRHVGAFEYSVWGVVASVLASVGISDSLLRRREMLPVLLLLLPIFFLGFVIEYVMFLCGNTPISVVTAEKSLHD